MMKSAVSKVLWVGRATVFLVGLAVILALLFGAATTALGATGGNFILGRANGAGAVSKLTARVAGPALNLINRGTNSAATALDLQVAPGHAPLTVNSSTKVANLNADQLDGKDSTEFLAADGKAQDSSHADNATSADDSNTLGGKSANQLTRAASGESHASLTLTNTFQSYGQVTINAPAAGYVMVTGMATVQGSGFCENCFVQGLLVNKTNGASIGSTEGSDVPAGGYAELSDTAVLPVVAGSNTIALNLIGTGTGGSTISAASSHVSALYSPYDGNGNPR